MNKILISAVVLVLSVGAVAYAMSEIKEPETYSWRYKLTVEIDTPEGVKTGSAVREVTSIKYPTELDSTSPRIETKLKGEAVVVDLGRRGSVFVLLKGGANESHDHAKYLSQKIFSNPPKKSLVEHYKENFDQLKGKAKAVPDKYHSLMVTFKDTTDPKSIKFARSVRRTQKSTFVHPEYVTKDNFTELFGEGVVLKNIELELTNESVSWGIEDILPWLPERKNIKGYIGGDSKPPYKDPTNTYLTGMEFSVGKFWLTN